MSAPETPTLSDQFVTACLHGDLPMAERLLSLGASVNDRGAPRHWGAMTPLYAAACRLHYDAVVWLLSRGAAVGADRIMFAAVQYRSRQILELVVDAGGDVNAETFGWLPLVLAVRTTSTTGEMVAALLAQPCLDVHVTYLGRSVEALAVEHGKPHVADLIAREVSGS